MTWSGISGETDAMLSAMASIDSSESLRPGITSVVTSTWHPARWSISIVRLVVGVGESDVAALAPEPLRKFGKLCRRRRLKLRGTFAARMHEPGRKNAIGFFSIGSSASEVMRP